ncbi:conserved exported hypothetical protein [Candidatus Terasakiella magnetica]|nr:conserved exported hypothetical protein [Candidatus Terasakiella magnetica]
MIKRLFSLAAAALAALVSGCGDGPATVPSGIRSAATWSSMVNATKDGPMLLVVHGDPFGLGAEEQGRRAAEAMSGAIPGRPFAFTARPQAAARQDIRVVIALGGPEGADPRKLCSGASPLSGLPTASGRLNVVAAFCDGDGMLSGVRGWVAKVKDADDRRFHQLLGQVVRDLMGEPQ